MTRARRLVIDVEVAAGSAERPAVGMGAKFIATTTVRVVNLGITGTVPKGGVHIPLARRDAGWFTCDADRSPARPFLAAVNSALADEHLSAPNSPTALPPASIRAPEFSFRISTHRFDGGAPESSKAA